ncbi:cytochrome c biogenesis protein ResB [Desulfuromonas versatilis]|uniref:Cytochrome c biogenesis protein ResB n=1 Tax=Desulfuromonas versatilis TaxID=2802975 RepID=A0ABN6DV65_9BACT|nr:cytochrome c biogenesis protein ResB [Desulfuromonas versatilis]BCR03927.1 cytochrome c biogenesis protein ResB [Desulfuromonas versatilis]
MSTKRSPIDALWDFFCSLKLTIITLILLAVTSIIGTVIQQNLSPQEYLQIYSETTYRVLNSLQFFDMYHSWWFLALLGIFSINLIACSIKRFPRVWKTVHEPVLTAEDSLFRTFSNVEEHVVSGSPADYRDKIAKLFKENFAEPVVTEKEGKIHFFAQKGKYSRFGVYVTHLSILIIFLGAIIGNLWGYKAFVNIVEGTQTTKVWPRGSNEPLELGFAVHCESFSVSFYPGSNRPKEFKSILTVLEDGKPVSEELTNRPIIVNDPLRYKGITFYQSSYGPTGDPIFNFRVKVRETGETLDLVARQGQMVKLPDGGGFRVVQFAPSFQNFGPGARLETVSADGKRSNFVVLQAFPEFDAQRGGDYIFSMGEYKQRYYTGLQVAKDPGVWVVWLGCFLMVVGCIIAFFLSHRRIWLTIQPVGQKTGIKLGGSAHRNQPAFELFFDEFKKNLKNEIAS